MELKERNWKLGEVVILPRTSEPIWKSGQKAYEHMTCSKYVCVREAADGQLGILVKMIGRVPEQDIMTINGEPFCKDEKEEAFEQNIYYSYPFPTIDELKEVFGIVRANDTLWHQLNDAGMHINPNGTFWVKEMSRKMLVLKKPLYYDPKTDLTETAASADELHRRLSIAYFSL